VVPWDVKKRYVDSTDQVFEVVERQVSTRKHDVRAKRCELFAVQRFVDLIGDCEYSRQGFRNVPSTALSMQAPHINKDEGHYDGQP
jgi:hypothetical protein